MRIVWYEEKYNVHNEKRELNRTKGMFISYQETIITLRKKSCYKYHGILETDSINLMEEKESNR